MIVVSDNSPINVLIRIGEADLLPALFGSVVLPLQVADEMKHPAAPEAVRLFIQSPPPWLSIVAPSRILELKNLDLGERAAISLALELHADLLLVDERDGRAAALAHGLSIVGAIGVLERAADAGLLADLRVAHDRIRLTNFRVADQLLSESLARHLAGRPKGP